ncbi:hypothetical protein D3C86_2154990 [compost metagenome]
MVVDHIHDNAQTPVMERLNHGFELGDAQARQIGVCRIRALRRVEILRIIAPVKVRLI